MNNNFFQILISDSDESVLPPNIESVKDFFGSYNHIVYNEQQLVDIANQNGDHDVARAITGFRPYSFKADLGRYYLLYRYGGWYSDINNRFLCSPPDLSGIDFLAFHDIPDGTPAPWAFQNSIIYSKSGSKQLQYAIESCLSYFNEKKYGLNALEPTGPILFGKSISAVGINPERFHFGFFREDGGEKFFILRDGTRLAKYKDLNPANPGIPGSNNYIEMWDHGAVY